MIFRSLPRRCSDWNTSFSPHTAWVQALTCLISEGWWFSSVVKTDVWLRPKDSRCTNVKWSKEAVAMASRDILQQFSKPITPWGLPIMLTDSILEINLDCPRAWANSPWWSRGRRGVWAADSETREHWNMLEGAIHLPGEKTFRNEKQEGNTSDERRC